MRSINNLTISEFKYYQELIDSDDMLNILDMFECSDDDGDITTCIRKISMMTLSNSKIKNYYTLNNKLYKCNLNLLKLNAEQFIDIEEYNKNFKLEELISVFLIPIKYKFLFIKIPYKYNKGYDIFSVQNDIRNYMKISDIKSLSEFFMKQSIDITSVINGFLKKKLVTSKYKLLKKQIKNEHIS